MNKPTYSVLIDETMAGLVVQVNIAMQDGWRCVGGPIESLEDGVCQAMQRDPTFDEAVRMVHDAARQLGLFNAPPGRCRHCGSSEVGKHFADCPHAAAHNTIQN